jgi:hypothetical protein
MIAGPRDFSRPSTSHGQRARFSSGPRGHVPSQGRAQCRVTDCEATRVITSHALKLYYLFARRRSTLDPRVILDLVVAQVSHVGARITRGSSERLSEGPSAFLRRSGWCTSNILRVGSTNAAQRTRTVWHSWTPTFTSAQGTRSGFRARGVTTARSRITRSSWNG